MPMERYVIRFEAHTEGDTAEVMIYGAIENDKWFDDDVTPKEFDKALKDAVRGGATKLNLRVNSPGGDVYSAVAMRSMIINSKFQSVRVMIEGLCASAATLFATVPGADVVIAEGSEFMIHNPWTIALGSASDLEKQAQHLRSMESTFRAMYAEKTGYADEVIAEWMDAETWFSAKEACEHGFCDELLSAQPVAACVSTKDMAVMRAIYRAVPEEISVTEDAPAVSSEAPVAGASTEIHEHEEEHGTMEIRDINVDQLRAENPALLEAIQRDAVAAERQRQDDIDALTVPGYEDMAAQAKRDGTSAMDFQKQIVAAMKAKGSAFLAARQQETAPAQDVKGGSPSDSRAEEEEIERNAREIADYAKAIADKNDESMF